MIDNRARFSIVFKLNPSQLLTGDEEMPRLVTLEEAAKQLGMSLAALRDWRFRRKHLAFVKVGRAVRVSQNSIDQLIERQTVMPLSER